MVIGKSSNGGGNLGSRKKIISEIGVSSLEGEKSEFALKLRDLDHLVSELTSENPKTDILKAQMNRLGIEFSENPTERMSRVLFMIQKIQFDFAQDLPEFNQVKEMKQTQSSRTKKVRKDGIEI